MPHVELVVPEDSLKPYRGKWEEKQLPDPRPGYIGAEEPFATHAGMVSRLDRGVGEVMALLKTLDLDHNTILLFSSDNGPQGNQWQRVADFFNANGPLRGYKGQFYEGGIRVPLIVRWPGVVKAGSTCDHPIISVDYFPTILEMARVKSRGQIDGVSLMPLLTPKGVPKRDAIYWHYPHYSNQGGPPGGAIRKGDYKLIEFYEGGRLELFNRKDDIGERVNLTRKEPRKAAELHAMLKRWRESVKASMPTVNPAFDADKADQGLRGAEPRTPE